MLVQQHSEELARSPHYPVSDSTSISAELPNSSDRANKISAFDATGAPVVSTKTLSQLETEADNAAASASAAAASASAASTSETNASTSATNAATFETNAATSATNAATSATNASTSATNAAASAETLADKYSFDSATAMADPGTGDVRLNNATVASVTQLALSANSAVSGNPDISGKIVTWDDSTNTPTKGTLTIRKAGTPATFATFSVTGVTDNTTWLQVTVTYVDGNGAFSAADTLYIGFSRAGNKGADGSMSGPGSSTDNAIARFNGTDGTTVQNSGVTIDDDDNLYGHGAAINAQTGTTFTLTAAENGKVVTLNNASAITLTLPQTSTETLAQGFQCTLIQRGAGQVTVAKEGSDTIESKGSDLKLTGQHSIATVVKLVAGSPNTWGLYGDLSA